jgi:hypothetical protein
MANAGKDTIIVLPLDRVLLNGGLSKDPDGTLSEWLWRKISGPASFVINAPHSASTIVKDFVTGIYQFELTVTNDAGLSAKDTVMISVVSVSTREIIFTDLTWMNQCYTQPDVPGGCAINGDSPSYGFYIKDTANIFRDSAKAILSVWVKMDASSVWEQVPKYCWIFGYPYPQTDFTYCLTPEGMSIYSWFFSSENLQGRKAEVKIWF